MSIFKTKSFKTKKVNEEYSKEKVAEVEIISTNISWLNKLLEYYELSDEFTTVLTPECNLNKLITLSLKITINDKDYINLFNLFNFLGFSCYAKRNENELIELKVNGDYTQWMSFYLWVEDANKTNSGLVTQTMKKIAHTAYEKFNFNSRSYVESNNPDLVPYILQQKIKDGEYEAFIYKPWNFYSTPSEVECIYLIIKESKSHHDREWIDILNIIQNDNTRDDATTTLYTRNEYIYIEKIYLNQLYSIISRLESYAGNSSKCNKNILKLLYELQTDIVRAYDFGIDFSIYYTSNNKVNDDNDSLYSNIDEIIE